MVDLVEEYLKMGAAIQKNILLMYIEMGLPREPDEVPCLPRFSIFAFPLLTTRRSNQNWRKDFYKV
jgi:hypothetical protein